MDTLSQLLTLYPAQAALDMRCEFGAPWVLDHPGAVPAIVPYHLIVAGSCLLDVGTRKNIELACGDVILFPGGAPHRLHTPRGAGKPSAARPAQADSALILLVNDGAGARTDILCGQFEFAPGGAGELLSSMPDLVHVRSAGGAGLAVLEQLIAILRSETATVRPGARAVIAQLASALFALVMRAWIAQGAAGGSLFALLAEPRLQGALHAMLDAPERPWDVASLAAACHMSRATFARVFQQVARTTPGQLLTRTRMARAALLLQSGRLPIGDVAERVGYQSEAAFGRVFKRQFGVGPGSYRRGGAGVPSPGGMSAPGRSAA
jgi:AraC family transcriptional activator of mtrCDE